MSGNPFLEGNYAPTEDETTAFDLPVHGEIPDSLVGRLMRIGPNPIVPPGPGHHWFSGNGLVHGLRLEGGKVSTVTFGLSRLAMFSSLRIKQQEEVVAVEHWLHSFDDLIIEELFLGEDKQLLE